MRNWIKILLIIRNLKPQLLSTIKLEDICLAISFMLLRNIIADSRHLQICSCQSADDQKASGVKHRYYAKPYKSRSVRDSSTHRMKTAEQRSVVFVIPLEQRSLLFEIKFLLFVVSVDSLYLRPFATLVYLSVSRSHLLHY